MQPGALIASCLMFFKCQDMHAYVRLYELWFLDIVEEEDASFSDRCVVDFDCSIGML